MPPAVKIDVTPHQGYPLYSAIAQQAQFTTLLSADGASQTQARFMLRTKALYLEVKLPKGAELWSAQCWGRGGGVPLKPQREGKSLLVGLPAGAAGGVYFLQLIYAAPVEAASAGGRGTLRVPALHLLLRAERQAQAVDLPLADLEWTVRLPGGYEATWAGGTLATEGVPKPHPAALDVAGAIYCLAGGVNPFYGVSQARENARRIPCANDQRETSAAVQSYESTQGKYLGWGAAAEPVPPCPPEPAEKPAVSVGAANAPCVKAPCCCAKAPIHAAGGHQHLRRQRQRVSAHLGSRDGTATFSGVIQNGSGTVDLTKNDNGYLGYAGTATYTAPVGGVSTPHVMASNLNVGDSRKGGFTQSGGTKAFSDYHAPGVNAGRRIPPPATSPYAGLLNNGGAVSQYNSTAAPPQSPPPVSLTGSGTVQMGNNSGVTDNGLLSFDLSSGTTTMATITRNGNNPNAPVRGSGGVAKTDSGMLILTGKDAYTGGDGKRLEAALKSPTQMEFNDAPLSDVIDYLQNYHHVEIQLDKRVLGEAGIATDTPVTKSLKGISLQSALRAMLRDLGLTYVVQNGIVLITTPAEADKRAEAGASFTADLDIPFAQGAYGKGRADAGRHGGRQQPENPVAGRGPSGRPHAHLPQPGRRARAADYHGRAIAAGRPGLGAGLGRGADRTRPDQPFAADEGRFHFRRGPGGHAAAAGRGRPGGGPDVQHGLLRRQPAGALLPVGGPGEVVDPRMLLRLPLCEDAGGGGAVGAAGRAGRAGRKCLGPDAGGGEWPRPWSAGRGAGRRHHPPLRPRHQ